MTRPSLVLSLFPGIDLLGRAFESVGYCVVRGPDPLFGGRIEDFHSPAGHFEGVIGGPPCQDFSRARRTPPTGDGVRLLAEFVRCLEESQPEWWLLENVIGVPDVTARGYHVQRFNLNARDCGMRQRRPRRFQFGYRDGPGLTLTRSVTDAGEVTPCCMASEGTRAGRRDFPEFCEAQGLPSSFALPSFTIKGRYRAVGNGVPIPMGRVVAIAIQTRHVTGNVKTCVCECGRPVTGKQVSATAACRKRIERKRDAAAMAGSKGGDA